MRSAPVPNPSTTHQNIAVGSTCSPSVAILGSSGAVHVAAVEYNLSRRRELEDKALAYRNKTYVAFDADNDIRYYYLMTAWKQNDNTSFSFHDAHGIRPSREWSSEETIKRNLRERLKNSKMFVCLIGEHTRYMYKFVRWEIETAMALGIPRIGCNLNGTRIVDTERCPPILRESLSLHVSFNGKIIQYALEDWAHDHWQKLRQGKTGGFYYRPAVYERLGL